MSIKRLATDLNRAVNEGLITIGAMAEKVNIHRATMSRFLNDMKNVPRIDTLEELFKLRDALFDPTLNHDALLNLPAAKLLTATFPCRKCGTTTPDWDEGGHYCIHCGTSLGFNCRTCGERNDPDARFCKQCGTRKDTILAAEDKPPYTPKGEPQ